MTIVTKHQLGDDEKDNEENLKKAAALVSETETGGFVPPPSRVSVAWAGDVPSEWYAQMRRRRLLTSLCFTLLVLWLLMAAFIGGVLFYRHLHRRPTFYGWCGTSYEEHGQSERLEQRLEIDPDEMYERIEVPKFGANRPAIFVHDFRQNLTAIVDVLADRCFIKELDRSHVAPPTSFIDLVQKMENGYYEQNPRVIRESYRVGSALDKNDLDALGSYMISKQCADRSSFMLRKAAHVLERAVPAYLRHKREAGTAIKFTAMDGDTVEVNDIIF